MIHIHDIANGTMDHYEHLTNTPLQTQIAQWDNVTLADFTIQLANDAIGYLDIDGETELSHDNVGVLCAIECNKRGLSLV